MSRGERGEGGEGGEGSPEEMTVTGPGEEDPGGLSGEDAAEACREPARGPLMEGWTGWGLPGRRLGVRAPRRTWSNRKLRKSVDLQRGPR